MFQTHFSWVDSDWLSVFLSSLVENKKKMLCYLWYGLIILRIRMTIKTL